MPLFDRPTPPPPRRTRWDRIVYGLTAVILWLLVFWEAFKG